MTRTDRSEGQPAAGTPGGVAFWLSVAAGWAVMGFGLRGLLNERVASNPTGFARLLVGAALVHDLLLAPLVFGVGVLVGRLVPGRARSLVQGALICSGLVALYAYPFVRGYGRAATNPSALPLDYGHGLTVVLVAVWAVTGAMAVARLRGRPRAG